MHTFELAVLKVYLQLFTPRMNSVFHGTESVSFVGPKIWDRVPNELKSVSSLADI